MLTLQCGRRFNLGIEMLFVSREYNRLHRLDSQVSFNLGIEMLFVSSTEGFVGGIRQQY